MGYYLDESRNWAMDVAELDRSITAAREKCDVRALVVINPGNPTGQVITMITIVLTMITTMITGPHQGKH